MRPARSDGPEPDGRSGDPFDPGGGSFPQGDQDGSFGTGCGTLGQTFGVGLYLGADVAGENERPPEDGGPAGVIGGRLEAQRLGQGYRYHIPGLPGPVDLDVIAEHGIDVLEVQRGGRPSGIGAGRDREIELSAVDRDRETVSGPPGAAKGDGQPPG